MRILIFSQYYFPETGATSNRAYSLAKFFQEEGHEVRVIAEKPNHPEGVFHEGFEKGIFIDGVYGGVPVTWCWVYTRQQKGFIGRILFYISYMIMAVLAVFRLKGRYDMVLATSPPLFVGVSGWAAAKVKHAKFIFDVRDLWPEVAVKMGELSNAKAILLAEKIEGFLYRKADLITPVTDSFLETIASKGIPPTKMQVIPNGTEPDTFNTAASKESLRSRHRLPNKCIVSFIGNMGLAQGLEHVIVAAQQSWEKGEDQVLFLFVGDGPRKERLVKMTQEAGLTNVLFRDRVPLELAVEYMNASDYLIVSLANDPIYAKFIPSKLFDSMAASKPVLLSVDGESRVILDASAAGIYYPAENAPALLAAIDRLRSNPMIAQEMGLRGRDYVTQHFSRRAQALKMLEAMKRI